MPIETDVNLIIIYGTHTELTSEIFIIIYGTHAPH